MLESRSVTLSPLSPAAAIQVQITPRTGEVSIGDSKLFLCQVVGEASEIDWYSPSGEKILPDRDDFSVSRNDEATSLLIIYKATESSAGIYKCVARSEDKEAQATVELTIFQRITFSNAPSRQEFNEGDNALILCNVVSSPAPQILWKYKGTRIYSNQDVRFSHVPNGLQIRGIKKNDEGMYTCEARVLTRGEIDFRMIEVVVNVLPTIRARQSDINATAEVGNSVMLACDADGFPEPMVTWVHNNVVLESGDKYSLNEDGSELLIKDVKKVDEGDYTCMAKNKAGEKSEEVSLNVFVQPTITYLSNQTASEFDEQVTLTCEASGDPTPTISWSFENRVFTEGEQSLDRNIVVLSHARLSSLTLKNVQFTYAGQYLCSAANAIGQDSRAVHLEVRYAPKVLGSVVVYTWEGNPANISCEVKAHPGASVLWFRDGLPLPSANSSNIKIYHTPTTSYLEVNPNSQTDFGSYNCTATNVMGTESKEFLLISADVPSPPEIEAVRPFSSTAVVEFAEPASTGGVPVLRYKVEWRLPSSPDWTSAEYKPGDADAKLTIGGLKPETVYEVKMSAINGKGQGDSSPSTPFKTEPVREPSAPKLEAKFQNRGNSFKVNWIKQDDGGSPIKHYLVRYKAKHGSDWKPEIRIPHNSEYVVLSGLDWDTEYEVHVVAENQQGKSDPGVLSFRTSTEPSTMPGAAASGSGLGTGAIVGILIVVFFLLLVGVDVTCYFLNKCGLLMCIAVNFCGKAGPGAKAKDMEEGKAEFTKDESKEPIVEVRTEEGNTPNQGGGPTEPNETTPLTEPEPAGADSASQPANLLPPADTSNSAAQSSPASDSTTLTAVASSGQPDVGPLVDLSDAPKVAPSSDQTAREPLATPSDSAEQPQQNQPGTQSPQLPVEGAAPDTPTAQNDGKAVKEDGTAAEAKEAPSGDVEVKTVPSEAPQMNGNESKA
ncbi:neural cell adhesion molecule 1a isoform X2 [Nelusetta ayraudi]|uniref:neural cell adhesion molecule 1a isoform X2 n=1 Tax=Nelusetta ayraudi TaxID=303726 RepID=UPI003F71E1BE